MANIDRIVNVTISLQTASVTSLNFSDLLLFGVYESPDESLVNIITDPLQLVDNFGCTTSSPIYKAATVFFSQIPHPPRLFIGLDDGVTDPTGALNALNAENSDWYGICNAAHTESRVEKIAQWVEAHEKIFVTVLADPLDSSAPGGDTTSVAHILQTGNYFRTAWWYTDDWSNNFPDVAIAARSFTKYPGQETWANQRLSAVPSFYLPETTSQNIFTKNGNTFEPFRNINITQNGKTAGGEWIDVIRFRDWLCDEIKVRIFNQLIDNRIPYTDTGIAIIRSRLQQALDFGVLRGGIAPPELNSDGDLVPSYTVSVPLAATIDANTKASRVLHDVYFTARLAGAIHAVEIQGTLTYETLPVAAAVA